MKSHFKRFSIILLLLVITNFTSWYEGNKHGAASVTNEIMANAIAPNNGNLSQVHDIAGKVLSVSPTEILMEAFIAHPDTTLGKPDTIKIMIDSNTSFYRLSIKGQEQTDTVITSTTTPNTDNPSSKILDAFDKIEITSTEIRVGENIFASSEDLIFGKKEFTASSISIMPMPPELKPAS